MGGTWSYLDITALGRQEEWEDLAGGLPADPDLPVVEAPRRVRRIGGGRLRRRARRADRALERAARVGELGLVIVAHVGGVPLEEIAPSITGAGLLLAGTWLMLHLRGRREPGK